MKDCQTVDCEKSMAQAKEQLKRLKTTSAAKPQSSSPTPSNGGDSGRARAIELALKCWYYHEDQMQRVVRLRALQAHGCA